MGPASSSVSPPRAIQKNNQLDHLEEWLRLSPSKLILLSQLCGSTVSSHCQSPVFPPLMCPHLSTTKLVLSLQLPVIKSQHKVKVVDQERVVEVRDLQVVVDQDMVVEEMDLQEVVDSHQVVVVRDLVVVEMDLQAALRVVVAQDLLG